jgi:Kdo2-lipid IVA lauroyltransferase/acyltransferase
MKFEKKPGRPRKAVKNTLIFWSVLVVLKLLSALPMFLVRGFLLALGQVIASLPIKLNDIASANITAAYPEMSDSERRRLRAACYRSLGRAIAETVKMASGKLRGSEVCIFTPGSREMLNEALKGGTGLVSITAHTGNWELMAAFVAEEGFTVNTIAKESYDPRFTRLLRDVRETRGVHCIWKGDPDIRNRITDALAKPGLLGFLIDQDTKVPGVFAPFFGREAFTPSLPAKLVVATGAPAISIFNHRGPDGRLHVTVGRFDTKVPEGADPVRHLTALFNGAIEAEVRAHPGQWVWMHYRWKTRPKTGG